MDRFKDPVFIGEGSFGKVYKATEKKTDNIVALKIIGKVMCILILLIVDEFQISIEINQNCAINKRVAQKICIHENLSVIKFYFIYIKFKLNDFSFRVAEHQKNSKD